MTDRENAQGNALLPGVMKELCILGAQAMPAGLSSDEATLLLGEKRGMLVKALRAAAYGVLGGSNPFQLVIAMDECLEAVISWRKFYKNHLGIQADYVLRMPKPIKGASQPIIVCPDLTELDLWTRCEESFPCGAKSSLKRDIKFVLENVRSVREAKDCAYGVLLIDEMPHEAFEAFACAVSISSKNTNILEGAALGGKTLKERLLYELKYHAEHGCHSLPEGKADYCLGSDYFGGAVPVVRILDGKFFLDEAVIGHPHGSRQIIY